MTHVRLVDLFHQAAPSCRVGPHRCDIGCYTAAAGACCKFPGRSCRHITVVQVHLMDPAHPEATPLCVAPRREGIEYFVEHCRALSGRAGAGAVATQPACPVVGHCYVQVW